jgi:hypothetical protein
MGDRPATRVPLKLNPTDDDDKEPTSMVNDGGTERYYVMRSHTRVVSYEIVEFASLAEAASCVLALNDLAEPPARVIRLADGVIPGAERYDEAEHYLVVAGLLPELRG